MRFPSMLLAVCAAAGLCGCGGNDAVLPPPDFQTPDPSGPAPSATLDLDHWALTLPVDAGGGTSGTARTVRPSELVGGYQSDWFYGSANGGVTFWAPLNGALTPSAHYARSELREMLDPSDPAVNWTSADAAHLAANVAVNQVPLSNGRIVVGKILGYNGTDSDISFLAHLVYEYDRNAGDGAIFAVVEHSPQGGGASAERFPLVAHQPLNAPFDYSIDVANGTLTISAAGQTASTAIDPQWAGTGLYFRAGAGLQARGADASEGGRATFYTLTVTH